MVQGPSQLLSFHRASGFRVLNLPRPKPPLALCIVHCQFQLLSLHRGSGFHVLNLPRPEPPLAPCMVRSLNQFFTSSAVTSLGPVTGPVPLSELIITKTSGSTWSIHRSTFAVSAMSAWLGACSGSCSLSELITTMSQLCVLLCNTSPSSMPESSSVGVSAAACNMAK